MPRIENEPVLPVGAGVARGAVLGANATAIVGLAIRAIVGLPPRD